MSQQDTRERWVEVDQHHQEILARQIADEQHACERRDAAIAQLVTAVLDYPPLWGWGDGHGGVMWSTLWEAFEAAGLEMRDPISPRRAPKKQQLSAKLRAQVFARNGLRCVHCDCDDIELLGVDHIVAEVNGGPHTLDNLQTLCGSCNSKKGTR